MRKLARTVLVGVGIGCISVVSVSAGTLVVGGTTIYSGAELSEYCSDQAGNTYICFPGTRRWALLDTEDAHFPMPTEEVAEAVLGVTYPVDGMNIDLLILPAPRRDLPTSSAEGTVIFLSPGRIPYPNEHIHYTVAHEIGHVVHHVLMPDKRRDLWQAYADLRGLGSLSGHTSGSHASRLHEMFAEDFRVLFGGETARCGGEVENHDIRPPAQVEGLKEFMLSLLDEWAGQTRISAYPNPFETSIVLRGFSLDSSIDFREINVFDVRGKRVKTIIPLTGGCDRVIWDGNNDHDRPVAPGLYVITLRTDLTIHIYKVLKAPK